MGNRKENCIGLNITYLFCIGRRRNIWSSYNLLILWEL